MNIADLKNALEYTDKKISDIDKRLKQALSTPISTDDVTPEEKKELLKNKVYYGVVKVELDKEFKRFIEKNFSFQW